MLFDFVLYVFVEPTLPNHDLFCLHATRHFVSLKRFVRCDHQSGAALFTFSLENGILLTRYRESPEKKEEKSKEHAGLGPFLALRHVSLVQGQAHSVVDFGTWTPGKPACNGNGSMRGGDNCRGGEESASSEGFEASEKGR